MSVIIAKTIMVEVKIFKNLATVCDVEFSTEICEANGDGKTLVIKNPNYTKIVMDILTDRKIAATIINSTTVQLIDCKYSADKVKLFGETKYRCRICHLDYVDSIDVVEGHKIIKTYSL